MELGEARARGLVIARWFLVVGFQAQSWLLGGLENIIETGVLAVSCHRALASLVLKFCMQRLCHASEF